MPGTVKLVGLDFGTTTCSAVIASAQLTRNAVNGRTELDGVRECYRSDLIFTPLNDHALDVARLEDHLDAWLTAGDVRPGEVFGGGALLTGLTAQRGNADLLVTCIRRRLGDALVASADDPCLESWLAFMGSCSSLSRAHPDRAFLNLDIGGGTTNLALGQAGEVRRTGCLYVGARHLQVVPGSYRITRVSRYGQALLDHLGIARGSGDQLTEREREAILDFYLGLLQAAVLGDTDAFERPIAQLHQQVALRLPADGRPSVTFSGGVGQLIYAHRQGVPWPTTTCFGDLGIDLAQRLVATPFWAERMGNECPASAGRATVLGLLRHSTEISGATLFLPRPETLPLTDVPILGTVGAESSEAQVHELLGLVRRSVRGACLHAEVSNGAAGVRAVGGRLARVLRETAFPASHPLVLVVRENVGKILGQYVTEWGTLPIHLVVIDELAVRNAQYVHLGAVRDQVVPVSFYGLGPDAAG